MSTQHVASPHLAVTGAQAALLRDMLERIRRLENGSILRGQVQVASPLLVGDSVIDEYVDAADPRYPDQRRLRVTSPDGAVGRVPAGAAAVSGVVATTTPIGGSTLATAVDLPGTFVTVPRTSLYDLSIVADVIVSTGGATDQVVELVRASEGSPFVGFAAPVRAIFGAPASGRATVHQRVILPLLIGDSLKLMAWSSGAAGTVASVRSGNSSLILVEVP